jgi:excisionase family DNA binding protein
MSSPAQVSSRRLRTAHGPTPQQSVAPSDDRPLLMGVPAAARELGLGRDSAYALVHEGRLRAVHVGRRVLIPRTELAAFVEREAARGDV